MAKFTRRAISLHHLNTPELSAVELIHLAHSLQCEYVCLFTQIPPDATSLPLVDDADVPAVKAALAETGIKVHGVTSFPVVTGTPVEAYRAGLARGQAIGAELTNIRVLEPNLETAREKFAQLVALCLEYGLRPCLEFTGFNKTDALTMAADLIQRVPGSYLTVDALHLVRSGASWDYLRDQNTACAVGYIQLCDGPLIATAADYEREGPYDRIAPGEGQFPLTDMLNLLPNALPLCLEIPSITRRQQGMDATRLATHIVTTTRNWLARNGL